VASVVVRMPDGTRRKRKFFKSENVSVLKDWISDSVKGNYSIETAEGKKLQDFSKSFDALGLAPRAVLTLITQ
jgi:hypothetical protein